jgi:hypothetical protein
VPHKALYLRRVPPASGRVQIAMDGSAPRWDASGRALFFLAPGGRLMVAAVDVRAPLDNVHVRQLCVTRAPDESGLVAQIYDVAPDGRRFLVKMPARAVSAVVTSGWLATPR